MDPYPAQRIPPTRMADVTGLYGGSKHNCLSTGRERRVARDIQTDGTPTADEGQQWNIVFTT
eukprot:scaffold82154_cov54-Attheya_sp.AAC.1